MTDEAMSPLRRRMIEDMTIRKFAPKTQHDYVQRIKNFAAFSGVTRYGDLRGRAPLPASSGGERRWRADPQSGRIDHAVLFPGQLRRHEIVEHTTSFMSPQAAGGSLPRGSGAAARCHTFYRKGPQGAPSDVDTRLPENWIDVERGRQAPTMSEQVYLQSNGFALIMLWYEPADDPDYDEDGERTAKERLKHRQSRYT